MICIAALATTEMAFPSLCCLNVQGKTSQLRLRDKRHRFLCFLRAAQLPSQDCVCSPVMPVQYSRVRRSATSATVVFRGGKPAHRKVHHTCAGSLAAPVRTRAFIARFAHSNVASPNASSHGSKVMTQAVHSMSPARGVHITGGGGWPHGGN